MSSLFKGKNLVIAGLVSVILAYGSFVAFSAFHKEKVEPDAPEIVLNKASFEIGDQIQVKVKHNRTDSKYTVNWNVLDGYSFKNDYTLFGTDNITFGSGAVKKTFLVICNVNYLVEGEIKSYNLYVQVKIGNGPLPPPGPGPIPPDPKPPTPAPIPVAGLRVLIVEETAERIKLTKGQLEFISSAKTRSWLDSICVKENNQPAYRIYDKDASAEGDSEVWRNAMARPRTTIPWIIVSNGTTGFEGPMPATVDEIKSLIQKHIK